MQHRDALILAFRHLGPSGAPPFDASLVIARHGQTEKSVDLSAHALKYGIAPVADPKLLLLDDDVWVTFNDGWSDVRNRLFLMRVTPRLGSPLECEFAERQSVEKNWAFLVQGSQLLALYALQPLQLLKSPWPPRSDRCIRFTRTLPAPTLPLPERRRTLSIGTQPFAHGDDHLLIAHEKWNTRLGLFYTGRSIRLRRNGTGNGTGYTAEASHRRLSHSLMALLGSPTKHNPRLASCTYFSGLAVSGDTAILSYGINDVSSGFAEIPLELL